MKRAIAILILFSIFVASADAITLIEKLVYKKDVIKAYTATILVNPLTNEIKYLWYGSPDKKGHWEPVSGTAKAQFQAMYDQQIKLKY